VPGRAPANSPRSWRPSFRPPKASLGKLPGILTFTVDFLKGFVPAMIARHYFYIPGSMDFIKGHWWIPVTAGALAIAGHIWTPFLGFRGGKGVATAAGVFMALLPVPTAGAFVVFGIAVAVTGHFSVGSMSASVALPILCYLLAAPYQRPFTLLALIGFILGWLVRRRGLRGGLQRRRHFRRGRLAGIRGVRR